MRNKFLLLIISFIILIFLSLLIIYMLPVASASFTLGNYSIQKTYGPEEALKGWINISLLEEESDSLFSLDGESISLRELLDLNSISGSAYNCTPSIEDCQDDYSFLAGETSKTISLTSQNKTIGFKLQYRVTGIDDIRFDINSTAEKSCDIPLKIDILNNGQEWEFNNVSQDFRCADSRGCFSGTGNEIIIDEKKHCEKINLVSKPTYKIGAWLKKSGSATLKAWLYDESLSEIESCNINLVEVSESGGEAGCVVESEDVVEGEYYVCITSQAGSAHKIKYETSGENCGFYENLPDDPDNTDIDYYIFVKAAKYSEVGNFTFNNKTYDEDEDALKEYVWTYIDERYNGDCSDECAIPVKISGINQDITISNVFIKYSTTIGARSTDKVYLLESKPAKLSSGFLKLNLDNAGLKVPEDYGSHEIKLELSGEEIFEELITVTRVSEIKDIYPTRVAAAIPTTFYASVETPLNVNITKYIWNFGVGNDVETTLDNIEYTYTNKGNYTLKLSIQDTSGATISKEVEIKVDVPREIANQTIGEYRENIDDIKRDLTSIPSWYKSLAEAEIGIEALDSGLSEIEREYSLANSDSEYIAVMGDLVALKVPEEMRITRGSLAKFVEEDEVDLAALSSLGAGSYEASYKEAVAKWFNSMGVSLDYETISLNYGAEIEEIVSVFKIRINTQETGEAFLVLEADLSDAKFKADYQESLLTGKTGIVLSLEEENIIELANEYIEPAELVIYMSPKFSELETEIPGPCNFNEICEKELGEDYKNCRKDCKPWGWVIFWFVIMVLAAFIVYIVMQQWYKRNYEKSLFKNRNDLFNLLNFINNAKSQKMDEGEIKRKLKAVGWTGEQISYVMKKAEGKFVGMVELPFMKLFKLKKTTSIVPRPSGLMPVRNIGQQFNGEMRFRGI